VLKAIYIIKNSIEFMAYCILKIATYLQQLLKLH